MKQKITEILKGEYLSSFLVVGFVQAAGMGLNYGVNIWLTRNLTVKDYGIWSYSFQTLVMVFMAFALVGNPQFILRETVRNIAAHKWDSIRATLKRSIGLTSIAIIIGSLVIYFGATFWYEKNIPSNFYLLFLLLYGITLTFGRIRQSYQQATGQNKYSQIPERVIQPMLFLLLIFLLYEKSEMDSDGVIFYYGISSLIALGVSIFFIKKISLLEKENQSNTPLEKQKRKVSRTYFFLIAMVDIIDSNVDLYLIKSIGFEEVAFYSVSKRIASILQMLLVASNYTFLPLLNQYFIKEDKKYLQKRIYKIVGLNIAIATVLFVALLVAKNFLLGLFDEKYVEGVSFTLYFLALLAQWVNLSLGMPGAILNVSGNEKYTLITFALAIVVQLVLGKWIIPLYGMEGMSFVYVVNTVFWNLTMAIIARKKTGLKSSYIT